MTDKSRVEAVARAIHADLWSNLDKPSAMRPSLGFLRTPDDYERARDGSLDAAQAAIEADTAWLKAQAAADIERWTRKAEQRALSAFDSLP